MKAAKTLKAVPISEKAATIAAFQEFQKKAKSILLETDFLHKVYELKSRWVDERGFEDFSDYVRVLRSVSGVGDLIVNKSFTITYVEGHFEYTLKCPASGKVTGSSKGYVKFV